jgi:predicted methyltransferase
MNKFLLACLLVGYCAYAQAAETTDPFSKVLAGHHRSAEHKHRDQYRHPEQTLAFFEVKDNMTVLEIWPGDGWYTEILAPYLKDQGKFYVAHFSKDVKSPQLKKSLNKFISKLKSQPKIYARVELTTLQPPDSMQIAPDDSMDRILTFLNVHHWMKMDQAATVFKAMFKALKPGGILGVVEHRNISGLKPQDPHAISGYVSEDYVIELARNAGFEFLEKSEINANPKDTKDYPDGVWTLPPTLRLKDKDRSKYLSIGESDRMTLKFIKP